VGVSAVLRRYVSYWPLVQSARGCLNDVWYAWCVLDARTEPVWPGHDTRRLAGVAALDMHALTPFFTILSHCDTSLPNS